MSASDESSFQNNFNEAQNSFNQTKNTISAGIIAAIVIASVVVIGAVIAVFIVWRRQKKRRAARMQAFDPKYNQHAPMVQGTPFVPPSQRDISPIHPYQQNEMPGKAVEPRWEVPFTPAALPEVSANEVKTASFLPSNSRQELIGSDARRSELAA